MEIKLSTMETKFDWSLLIVRVVTGTVILAHGVQKVFGWFGGYGFDGTMEFFTGTIGLPYVAGVVIILIETIGMLFLIAGLLTRVLSFGAIVIMIGAISFHSGNGFFMNWGNVLQGEGYEFHILIIALATVPLINGGGEYSLDKALMRYIAAKNH